MFEGRHIPERGLDMYQSLAQQEGSTPKAQQHRGKFAMMVERLALARQALGAGGLGTVYVLFIPPAGQWVT